MNPSYPNYNNTRKLQLKPIILIGTLILIIVVAVAYVFSLANSEPTTQMQHLSARLDTLKRIIVEGSKNASGGDLKKVNSDASILIAGDSFLFSQSLAASGIDKIDKNIIAEEADVATFDELQAARVNGRFDSTYKKTLSQKIDSTIALVREVRDKTSSKQLKTQLQIIDDHLNGILNQLAAI